MSPTALANSGTGISRSTSSGSSPSGAIGRRRTRRPARPCWRRRSARLDREDLRLLATVAYVARSSADGRSSRPRRDAARPEADPEAARRWDGRRGRRRVRARGARAREPRRRASGAGTSGSPGTGARPGGLGRQPSRRLDLAVPAAEEARAFASEAASRFGRRGRRSFRPRSPPRAETLGCGPVHRRGRADRPAGRRELPPAAVQIARGMSALGAADTPKPSSTSDACSTLRPGAPPADLDAGHRDLAEAAAVRWRGRRRRRRRSRIPSKTRGITRLHNGLRFARALLADDGGGAPVPARSRRRSLGLAVRPRPRLLAYGAWLRRSAASPSPALRSARHATPSTRSARRWGERARQELRASGETSRPRTPEVRDRLTPQELQIAQMAAEASRTGNRAPPVPVALDGRDRTSTGSSPSSGSRRGPSS